MLKKKNYMKIASRSKKIALCMAAACMGLVLMLSAAMEASTNKVSISADSAIVGVKAIGFMAADAAKLSAIVVEYNVDMKGADVNEDTYTLDIWTTAWNANCVNFGNGNIGDITKIYVNNKPAVSAKGGTGNGKYVIIEVYTDYQYASEQNFLRSMSAGITQTGTITTESTIIVPGTTEVKNYTGTGNSRSAIYGTFTIKGIEGFKFFTNTPGVYGSAGPAFRAENCFSEQSGTYSTVDMAYALYVPKDYNPHRKYALVTVDHPAASPTTHPMESVVTSRGPSVFASDWAQKIVKHNHDLAGLIVVVPVITQRVGDNSCTPPQFPALVKLWDYLQEEYSISKDHIYGAGQSVGGMMILETNAKRDNYFAGILLYDNQWGQNYYKDEVFARGMTDPAYIETAANTPRHYPTTDEVIWNYHWVNGKKVFKDHDYNNYYYLISDDNILLTNSNLNFLSNNLWIEQNYLYKDLVGYEIPRLTTMDPHADIELQEQMMEDYLLQPNKYHGHNMGINWVSFQGGSNMIAPIWARRMHTGYEWLLSQTRETEMSRPKLDINKPFKLAENQDASRVLPNFTDPETGGIVYYLTGKAGSGTKFYNTCWLRIGNNVSADEIPGWLPEGMTHPVKTATIEGVTAIKNSGKLTAVAVKYNTNMENAVIYMMGDYVLDSMGQPRTDDFVTMETFDFYNANGEKISGEITNIYINNSPRVIPGAVRGTGEGRYVIIEIDTTWDGASVGVIQRATVRTNEAIASASPKLYRSKPMHDHRNRHHR